MDSLPNQQPPQVVIPKSQYDLSKLLLILPVAIFIISAVAAFYISKSFLQFKQSPPSSYPNTITDPQALPIKFELLQSSVLSNWSGHVQGKIIQKTNDSFTLKPVTLEYTATGSAVIKEAAGEFNNLKVVYIAGKTTFKRGSSVINFPDVSLGAIVNGAVEIFKSQDTGTAIGTDFIIH